MCISYKNSSQPKAKMIRTKDQPFEKKHQIFNRKTIEEGDSTFIDERKVKQVPPLPQTFLQRLFA